MPRYSSLKRRLHAKKVGVFVAKAVAARQAPVLTESVSHAEPEFFRMSQEQFSRVTDKSGNIRNIEGVPIVCSMRLLRPRPELPKVHEQYRETCGNKPVAGNAVVNLPNLSDGMDIFVRSHKVKCHSCADFSPSFGESSYQGLGTSLEIFCTTCQYKETMRLYKLAEKTHGSGRRRLAINIQFAHALQDSTMGAEAGRYLLAQMDIPPPSLECIRQVTNDVVCRNTMAAAEADMARRNEARVEENLSIRRVKECDKSNVAISIDTRYNSPHFGNRKSEGQAASQAITTAIDCHTNDII